MKPKNYRQRRNFKEEKHFVGNKIKAQEVRCIDTDGNHSVMYTDAAIALANEKGLDLVQVSNNRKDQIPTCKILDYSKFKYEQSKKEKLAKKKQRENAAKIKEIKFRPSTGINDLKTKAKHAQEFIDEGNKLKITVVFRGREMAYKDVGSETLKTFIGFLSGVQYEMKPTISGRFLSAVLTKESDSASA